MVPSHYLNQCWFIVNLDYKEHISVIFFLIHFFKFLFKKMHLKMSAKCQPFCLDLNVLNTKEIPFAPEGSSYNSSPLVWILTHCPLNETIMTAFPGLNELNLPWPWKGRTPSANSNVLVLKGPATKIKTKILSHAIQTTEYSMQVRLTHCGLVTSYGDMELGQRWLR